MSDETDAMSERFEMSAAAMAAYVTVRAGRVEQTRELLGGEIMADFDRDGNLIGVEIIK